MKPLEGVRILDLSRMVAGAMVGMTLADFGADVVKVEQPNKGDPLRQWTTGGLPLWWRVYGRNKRCITLNIRNDEGRELLLKLIARFDVLIESFVPGTLERIGLSWEQLRAVNPGLIMLSISGWGHDGPGSQRPGFGTLVEAGTGLAAMTGDADRPPILPAAPLADMVSGLHAANAIAFALYHRKVHAGAGQVIRVSLFESLLSVLGPLPAEHAAVGKIRSRTGNRSSNSAPRGCYRTRDEKWIALSGSTPKMAAKILASYGLDHLLQDPRFATNEARVRHAEALDAMLGEAIGNRSLAENLAIIDRDQLTAYPVQNIADIERDPHWQALDLLVNVADESGPVRMQTITPRLSATPGEIRWPGAALGAHNAAIYCDELGLSREQLTQLHERGVV